MFRLQSPCVNANGFDSNFCFSFLTLRSFAVLAASHGSTLLSMRTLEILLELLLAMPLLTQRAVVVDPVVENDPTLMKA